MKTRKVLSVALAASLAGELVVLGEAKPHLDMAVEFQAPVSTVSAISASGSVGSGSNKFEIIGVPGAGAVGRLVVNLPFDPKLGPILTFEEGWAGITDGTKVRVVAIMRQDETFQSRNSIPRSKLYVVAV
jgi:hypothetical protein